MTSFIVVLAALACTQALGAADLTLLARNVTCKFYDSGRDLADAWRAPGFDDSAWKSGKAPLGFGDDFSETDPTLPIGTVVGFGPKSDAKNMTTYFRTAIDVPELPAGQNLTVYVHVDEGAVVYVNGTEAFRRGIDQDVTVNGSTGAKFKPKEETFTLPSSSQPRFTRTTAAAPTCGSSWASRSSAPALPRMPPRRPPPRFPMRRRRLRP